MDIGLHALGIGPGARRDVVDAVATAAESHGFSTLWSGEHVVMVDALSGGRLTLGVGVGWSRDEFDALGVPFARRAARTAEYVAAMRTLWRDDVASFDGEFVRFTSVRSNPKPVRDRRIPVVLGGNGDAALRRVVALGDGWYGFALDGVAEVVDRLAVLERACRAVGRDPAGLRRAVALREPRPGDLAALADAGVDELVIVESPPADAELVPAWIADLAARWGAGHPAPRH